MAMFGAAGWNSEKTTEVTVWDDTEAEKEAQKQLFSEGWGAVVGSRWLIALIVVLVLLIAFLGWRLSQVERIDLSSMPITVVHKSSDGVYLGATIANATMISREEMVPERIWNVIHAFREVSDSARTMLDNRAFLREHLDDQPRMLMNDYNTKHPPEDVWLKNTRLRHPVLEALVPQRNSSGDAWLVTWKEYMIMPGRAEPETCFGMTASVSTRFITDDERKRRTAAQAIMNPAGVKLTSFYFADRPLDKKECEMTSVIGQ